MPSFCIFVPQIQHINYIVPGFHKKFFLLFSLILWVIMPPAIAQQGILSGTVQNENNMPMEFVSVSLKDTRTGTTTNSNGFFTIQIDPNVEHEILFSFLGYQSVTKKIILQPGQQKVMEIVLLPIATNLPDIEIRERQIISGQYTKIDPNLTAIIPGPGNGVENLVKTMPGVSSATELSSQYSVRGGNYDENLVYVNGIEIYRPFLIRSGQQEGLSFLNSDLVSSISFSAGGFDAQYGDKMASVLDITYKNPDSFAGSFSISLLEGSLHLEDSKFDNKLRYLVGLRHKSNQYLLGTLDTQGDYKPQFSDAQAFVAWQFNPRWDLSFLGNFSRNQYQFIPDVQTTRFGTVKEVRQFTVFFQGQEADQFLTALGALSLNYTPSENQQYQLITSVFQTDETENFDIRGQYLLERVEADFGSSNFGEATGTPLGVGTFHNHARNYLNAIVWNIEHKAKLVTDNNVFKYGLKFQYEDIFDRLREWSLTDSAGFSIPRNPDPDYLTLKDTLNTRILLQSNRISGYVQNSHELENKFGRLVLTGGIRAQYWNFNRQWLFSPRATVLFKPVKTPRMVFRISGGLYQQPAFYKELRDMNGVINRNNKAQESLQLVLGSEYNMQIWGRPFKYTAEIYYKHFNNLIPYELDNVRIRYYANDVAKGYGAGIDMKINGEFVPGIESWASLSLMKTEEIIEGATFTNNDGDQVPLGYIPRPSDQRLTFSLFFQDFLPRNPSYKVNLALVYGSGLPLAPPTEQKSRNLTTMPPYRRVDIGFSKQLIGDATQFSEKNFLNHIESMWVTAEVFNLLEINNTISYLWIRDVSNDLYAVPNFLTSRLINVKLVTRF